MWRWQQHAYHGWGQLNLYWLCFQSQSEQPYSHLAEAYILHILWHWPLALHLPIALIMLIVNTRACCFQNFIMYTSNLFYSSSVWFYIFVGACRPPARDIFTDYKYSTFPIINPYSECSGCYVIGTQVRIDCSLNFRHRVKKGPEFRTCQFNGKWDKTRQRCESRYDDTPLFYYCLKFFSLVELDKCFMIRWIYYPWRVNF